MMMFPEKKEEVNETCFYIINVVVFLSVKCIMWLIKCTFCDLNSSHVIFSSVIFCMSV